MGYFSNAGEGQDYRAQYCDKCVHDKLANCPIWLLHLLWNGATNQDREYALDLFIARPKIDNQACMMFVAAA